MFLNFTSLEKKKWRVCVPFGRSGQLINSAIHKGWLRLAPQVPASTVAHSLIFTLQAVVQRRVPVHRHVSGGSVFPGPLLSRDLNTPRCKRNGGEICVNNWRLQLPQQPLTQYCVYLDPYWFRLQAPGFGMRLIVYARVSAERDSGGDCAFVI